MGKYITIISGIIGIILGLAGIFGWWGYFIGLIKGAVPPILVLLGLAAFFAGISELKDASETKKEEATAKKEGK